MSVPSVDCVDCDDDDDDGVVVENGEVVEGHRGGSGTRGEEHTLMKSFWPSSSLVLTTNLN